MDQRVVESNGGCNEEVPRVDADEGTMDRDSRGSRRQDGERLLHPLQEHRRKIKSRTAKMNHRSKIQQHTKIYMRGI